MVAATWARHGGSRSGSGAAAPTGRTRSDCSTDKSFPSGHAASAAAFAGVGDGAGLRCWSRQASVARRTVYASSSPWSARGRASPTGCCSAGTSRPTSSAARCSGAGLVLLGLGPLQPAARAVGRRDRRTAAARRCPPTRRLAVVLNPIKVEDIGQFRVDRRPRWPPRPAGPSRCGTTRRSRTPAPAWRTTPRSAGADLVHGLRWRRHRARGLRGARRHRHPGRDHPRRHRQPARPQPRHPAVPPRAPIDVALNGQDRAIDLVEVSGDGIEDTHFLVMAGMGFDAAMMEGVNEEHQEARSAGWPTSSRGSRR